MLFVFAVAASLSVQTVDDHQLLAPRALSAGFTYAHDGWSQYWEGTLKRDNGNIGTVTTQSITALAAYGITDRLTAFALLPYVWTDASAGPLHSMNGVQDFTLAAKYRVLSTPFTGRGTLRAFLAVAGGVPATDYTPDFLPLAIGLGSKRFSSRLTVNFQAHQGWFLNSTAAYTWRGKVTLDRPSYYTNGQLYLTNEVRMPNVVDYGLTLGYQRGGWCFPLTFSWQRTQGGADIRRQDMPFVSNRMDFGRVEGMAMYTIPSLRDLTVRFGTSHVISGRNVGQSTAFGGGLSYLIHF